jgi:hypothetical protein
MTEPLKRNETAVEEYLDKLEEVFESEEMKQHLQLLQEFPDSQLPASFDARLLWPMCRTLHWVPNQGACGSCYVSIVDCSWSVLSSACLRQMPQLVLRLIEYALPLADTSTAC